MAHDAPERFVVWRHRFLWASLAHWVLSVGTIVAAMLAPPSGIFVSLAAPPSPLKRTLGDVAGVLNQPAIWISKATAAWNLPASILVGAVGSAIWGGTAIALWAMLARLARPIDR